MKKFFLFVLTLITSFSDLLAQKTISDPNAEKRNVTGFHAIHVSTGIKLILTEGSAEEVAVSASKTEYRDKIITEVKNGVLKIYYENKLGSINKRKEKKELKAYVSYRSLDNLNANTGAEVQIEGTLKSSSLKMVANTGAIINGAININDLTVDQNTGSIVTLTGETGKIEVDGDTGSKFKGIDLKTDNCSATVSTGAGVYITVAKELNAKADTGGYVKYKGDAGIRELKTHTGGSISKI
jgi:hypothetical protein